MDDAPAHRFVRDTEGDMSELCSGEQSGNNFCCGAHVDAGFGGRLQRIHCSILRMVGSKHYLESM